MDVISQDEGMCATLASLKYLKGNYKHHGRPDSYLYDALALCQRTAEKQSASPLDLVSIFSEAVRLRKASVGHKSTRDLLSLCLSDYNRTVGKAGSSASSPGVLHVGLCCWSEFVAMFV